MPADQRAHLDNLARLPGSVALASFAGQIPKCEVCHKELDRGVCTHCRKHKPADKDRANFAVNGDTPSLMLLNGGYILNESEICRHIGS
jgi:hypothetical protein